jgi:transcriptional regulator with XRE-family HTH domain
LSRLGVSQKTISRIEQDGESISLIRLKKISDILNLDLQKLISFWNDENLTKTDFETIIDKIDKSQNHSSCEDFCIYKDMIQQMIEEIQSLKRESRYGIGT